MSRTCRGMALLLALFIMLSNEGTWSTAPSSIGPSSAPAAEPASRLPQPSSRSRNMLQGWNVLVDDRLFDTSHADLKRRTFRFLEAKLVDIATVVPESRLAALRKVTLVVDLNCGDLTSMQYHPSASWLKSHGYPETLARCVHIPQAEQLPTRRNTNEQPWVILHELAHAYHDQVLSFEEPRIRAAYDRFKQQGRGESVLLHNGQRVQHYALTNHKEFFAEMTEAYFGVNDFFPFNRAELQETEPELFRLLTQIWGRDE